MRLLFVCLLMSISFFTYAESIYHDLSDKKLQSLSIKNGKPSSAYLADKNIDVTLSPFIKRLIGDKNYQVFDQNSEVQFPVKYEAGVLMVGGMQAHSGGSSSSRAFFGPNGSLLVVIKVDELLAYYGDSSLLNVPIVASGIIDMMKSIL